MRDMWDHDEDEAEQMMLWMANAFVKATVGEG